MPIVEAAVIGSVMMVLSGCLPIGGVYKSVEWPVIFILAGLKSAGFEIRRCKTAVPA